MKPITSTIKGAIAREGLSGKRLAQLTGIPYSTLNYRYEHPETWKLCEVSAILRHVDFLEDELSLMGREVRKL